MKAINRFILFVFAILFLNSCGLGEKFMKLGYPPKSTYEGTVHLKNGVQRTGIVTVPFYSDKKVVISDENGKKETFNSEKIDKIVLHNSDSSIFRYKPIKKQLSKRTFNAWVFSLGEGANVSAYIGAEVYDVHSDGEVYLVGRSQLLNTGTVGAIGTNYARVNPSYPIYMIKKGGNALIYVAVREGVNFEASSFRSGVSRFLSDDAALVQHIRKEKWDFNNIGTIVEVYNPNRGNQPLVIDGVTIQPKEKRLITTDLDRELILSFETAFPTDKNYGTQFGIGIRSSFKRFFAYGGDLGYASAKFVDDIERVFNHPADELETAPVIDEDFSKNGQFRFNFYGGLQLPLNLNRFYLIPSAHYSFGAALGTEYGGLHHGPMAMLDFGIALRKGSILLIGGGYRHNFPIVSAEEKESMSYPGFEAYKPYGSLLLRIGYKW